MKKAMPQMMGLVSAEAIAEAKAVEQAAQAAREAQAVEWFREWHALLQRGLLSAPELVDPEADGGAGVLRLLEGFPRDQPAYRELLLRAQSLPSQAFSQGHALEMLCYMALQALPRHSRVYSNVHLGGGWHDALELRAVHNAVIAHEEKLQAAAKKRGEAANANTSDMETRHAHEANAVHLELDSESEDDGGDAGDGDDDDDGAPGMTEAEMRAQRNRRGSKVFKPSFAVNALVRRGSKTFERRGSKIGALPLAAGGGVGGGVRERRASGAAALAAAAVPPADAAGGGGASGGAAQRRRSRRRAWRRCRSRAWRRGGRASRCGRAWRGGRASSLGRAWRGGRASRARGRPLIARGRSGRSSRL